MLKSRMYKLEKFVLINKNIINAGSSLSDLINIYKNASKNDINYITNAVNIPYEDVLRYIRYYEILEFYHCINKNSDSNFFTSFADEFNTDTESARKRFKNVKTLSYSFLYDSKLEKYLHQTN